VGERPLWAPWRLEYIVGPKDPACFFCAAARGEGEPASRVIDRAPNSFTILNAFPYAPGHVMIAPARHLAALEELGDAELLETMQLAQRAIAALRTAMTPAGFNVGLNLGAVAGAGIADHLHMHVVPRWEGDTNFMPLIADTHVIPQALEATRDELLAALAKL
jgi:ATP adenylyltransferase